MKYFFTLIIALLALPGISQSTAARPVFNDAYDYNNYIVDQQDMIGKCFDEFAAFIADPVSTKKQAEAKRIELLAKVRTCETNIKNMPDWKGNTSLRDTAKVCFAYYTYTFEVEYAALLNIWYSDPFTETEEAKVEEFNVRIMAEQDKRDAALVRTQTAFGKEFGLVFEEEPSGN